MPYKTTKQYKPTRIVDVAFIQWASMQYLFMDGRTMETLGVISNVKHQNEKNWPEFTQIT